MQEKQNKKPSENGEKEESVENLSQVQLVERILRNAMLNPVVPQLPRPQIELRRILTPSLQAREDPDYDEDSIIFGRKKEN